MRIKKIKKKVVRKNKQKKQKNTVINIKENTILDFDNKFTKKFIDNSIIEKKEREYKFDERLVPFFVGSDTREGNLSIREALVKLGKTKEMTTLFNTIKQCGLDYDDEGIVLFTKALLSIIKGHDAIALSYVYEEDIEAIERNNKKIFDDFFKSREEKENELKINNFDNN